MGTTIVSSHLYGNGSATVIEQICMGQKTDTQYTHKVNTCSCIFQKFV